MQKSGGRAAPVAELMVISVVQAEYRIANKLDTVLAGMLWYEYSQEASGIRTPVSHNSIEP